MEKCILDLRNLFIKGELNQNSDINILMFESATINYYEKFKTLTEETNGDLMKVNLRETIEEEFSLGIKENSNILNNFKFDPLMMDLVSDIEILDGNYHEIEYIGHSTQLKELNISEKSREIVKTSLLEEKLNRIVGDIEITEGDYKKRSEYYAHTLEFNLSDFGKLGVSEAKKEEPEKVTDFILELREVRKNISKKSQKNKSKDLEL